MKITETTRFPYPVLTDLTNDYTTGKFIFDVEIAEALSGSGRVSFRYSWKIEEDAIQDLVNTKKASVGLFVICLETYYNQLMSTEENIGTIEFEAGLLNGRVVLMPLVWASEEIDKYNNQNVHPEFMQTNLDLQKGAILALGDENVVIIGREKLAPMETIFSLSKNDQVPEGETRILFDEHKIIINAAESTYMVINHLRNTKKGKPILLNSVYLPAVMDILFAIQDDPDLYQDRNWFRVFNAKCQYLNIDPLAGKIHEDAQKLLKSPFGRIKLEEEE